MKRAILLVTALALLLGGRGQAKADILFDNLSASSIGGDAVGATGVLADSFSTGPSASYLTDVKVLLNGSDTSGSISVTLLSDTSTSPGTTLDTLGTITLNANSLNGRYPPVIFDIPVSSIALTANTRYWIQLSSSTTTATSWNTTDDTSGTGVSGEYYSFNNAVSANNGNSPLQMQVTTGAAISTPEPSGIALFGMGVVCLAAGYVASRRKLALAAA